MCYEKKYLHELYGYQVVVISQVKVKLLPKFHVIEGQSTRDQITSDRSVKHL